MASVTFSGRNREHTLNLPTLKGIKGTVKGLLQREKKEDPLVRAGMDLTEKVDKLVEK